jgi:hypothetical protein
LTLGTYKSLEGGEAEFEDRGAFWTMYWRLERVWSIYKATASLTNPRKLQSHKTQTPSPKGTNTWVLSDPATINSSKIIFRYESVRGGRIPNVWRHNSHWIAMINREEADA